MRIAVLSLLAVAVNPVFLQAGSLEEGLLQHAPRVLKHLKSRHYQNVGVLQFHVQKGTDSRTEANLLNRSVADRLELALILTNDVRQPLGILHNATAVAATLKGAGARSKEGRQKLFNGRYPLAWGKQSVEADAFLTGEVEFAADLREMTVRILAFDRKMAEPERVAQLTASVSVNALVASGESFLLRGVPEDKEEKSTQQAVQSAAGVKKKTQKYPLADPAAPVDLQVCYDDRPVPLEFRDGRAFVPEPRHGQKVTLVLSRKGDSKERYGVVLKVNGENTLYRERLPDVDCRKWVLDPGDPPLTIRGFQTTGTTAEKFEVARPESKTKEADHGADLGMITLVVFREKTRKENPPPRPLTDEEEDLAALVRGIFPTQTPKNLGALQFQLRESGTRAVIVAGEKIGSTEQQVTFTPDPTPVLAATIVYHSRR